MRKIQILLLLLLFLSGCATYKFHKGQPPYDKGYVVSKGDYTILEYTLGKDNSVPDLETAKERLRRRKAIVEYYYKKMGYLEDRFKQIFWDPPALFVDFIEGIFRIPFIAASDYRYEHNPQYRETITKLEEKQDAYEVARIKNLREELNTYIQKDLAAEIPKLKKTAGEQPVMFKQEGLTKEKEQLFQGFAPTLLAEAEQKQQEIKSQLEEQEKARKKEELVAKMLEEQAKIKETKPQVSSRGAIAIIIAKPKKGFSPLKVQFYGHKSYSPHGKIISYYWEFGDGDTSIKTDPTNTYWSTTYGSKYFTVTLTVKDDKGNTSTSSSIIEVMTK